MKMIKRNIAYFIWSILCFDTVREVIYAISRNHIFALVVTAALYGIALAISFTTTAEMMIRRLLGLQIILADKDFDRLIPLFLEVKEASERKDRNLNSDIMLYIEETFNINASSLGVRTVAITRGAIESLDDEELKALIAHELGHISSGSTKALLIVGVCNWFYSVIVLVCHKVVNAIDRLLSVSNSITMARVFLAIVSKVLAIPKWIANLFLMANSRANEFVADEFAFNIGYGDKLIAILYKLRSLELENKKGAIPHLRDSHPYVNERIARLEKVIRDEEEWLKAMRANRGLDIIFNDEEEPT